MMQSKKPHDIQSINTQKNTAKILKKNVVLSFTQKDPALAKQAILDYAKAIYQVKNLSFQWLLENIQHEPLKKSLQQLEKALYAKNVDWHGEEALLAFEDWNEQVSQHKTTTPKRGKDDFSSLYPTE